MLTNNNRADLKRIAFTTPQSCFRCLFQLEEGNSRHKILYFILLKRQALCSLREMCVRYHQLNFKYEIVNFWGEKINFPSFNILYKRSTWLTLPNICLAFSSHFPSSSLYIVYTYRSRSSVAYRKLGCNERKHVDRERGKRNSENSKTTPGFYSVLMIFPSSSPTTRLSLQCRVGKFTFLK
jgi:hypothetical protein